MDNLPAKPVMHTPDDPPPRFSYHPSEPRPGWDFEQAREALHAVEDDPVEVEALVCDECGTVVGDPDAHDRWHEHLAELLAPLQVDR